MNNPIEDLSTFERVPFDSLSEDDVHAPRHSLIQRSKRVLGDDVDLGKVSLREELSQQRGKSKGTSKRREQVRKAQRTHRERTQTYMKTLEKEVLRLRDVEKQQLAKIENLQRQVGLLLNTLADHHISPPQDLGEVGTSLSPESKEPIAQVLLDPNDAYNLVKLEWSSGSSNRASSNEEGEQNSTREGPLQLSSAETTQTLNARSRNPPAPMAEDSTEDSTSCAILHDPRVGVDFVLALERPCLAHLTYSHLDHNPSDGVGNEYGIHGDKHSGHLFTASLALWKPAVPTRSEQEEYSIAKDQIDKLLQCCTNIPVDSQELTPVQIWNHLQSCTLPKGKEKETLEKIVNSLVEKVDCLHFGAVIDSVAAMTVLDEFIPSAGKIENSWS